MGCSPESILAFISTIASRSYGAISIQPLISWIINGIIKAILCYISNSLTFSSIAPLNHTLKFFNIETSEREDAGFATGQLMESFSLEISQKTGQIWLDEIRSFD